MVQTAAGSLVEIARFLGALALFALLGAGAYAFIVEWWGKKKRMR